MTDLTMKMKVSLNLRGVGKVEQGDEIKEGQYPAMTKEHMTNLMRDQPHLFEKAKAKKPKKEEES